MRVFRSCDLTSVTVGDTREAIKASVAMMETSKLTPHHVQHRMVNNMEGLERVVSSNKQLIRSDRQGEISRGQCLLKISNHCSRLRNQDSILRSQQMKL